MADSVEIADSCLFWKCSSLGSYSDLPRSMVLWEGKESNSWVGLGFLGWGGGSGWIMPEVRVGDEAQKIIEGLCVR